MAQLRAIMSTEHTEQLFFEIEVNSGKIFTEPRSGEVNIPKATIHRD